MKTRPILFKGEMVRAILEGRKTQTRRIINQKYIPIIEASAKENGCPALDVMDGEIVSPYGRAGDHLWVKETHCFVADGLLGVIPGIVYAADDKRLFNKLECLPNGVTVYNYDKSEIWRWRPSIFTHRWARRITLEIVNVRCERLQDITEADAIAEGIGYESTPFFPGDSMADMYRRLWNSINGDGSWGENPWVWAIDFKRTPTAQAEQSKGDAGEPTN